MNTIKFTATVIWKGKGCYVAHAAELPVQAEPATTQRGAIKNLKGAVTARLLKAAHEGKLATLLDDAGYHGDMINWENINFECHPHDQATITLPFSMRLSVIDREARRKTATGEERK